MKKILTILLLSSVFVACKDKKTSLETDKNMVLTNTAGLKNGSVITDKAAKGQPVIKSTETKKATGNPVKETGNNNKETPGQNTGSSTDNTTVNTNNSSTANQDKGISKAGQGVIIGATSGAVLGAIISKDKGKGAVIGGIIGGAGGYAIGRSKDKKSGRVARKKAARVNN